MDERIPPETKASAAAAAIRRWGPRRDGLTVRQKSHWSRSVRVSGDRAFHAKNPMESCSTDRVAPSSTRSHHVGTPDKGTASPQFNEPLLNLFLHSVRPPDPNRISSSGWRNRFIHTYEHRQHL
jgi:hypothetical protein